MKSYTVIIALGSLKGELVYNEKGDEIFHTFNLEHANKHCKYMKEVFGDTAENMYKVAVITPLEE